MKATAPRCKYCKHELKIEPNAKIGACLMCNAKYDMKQVYNKDSKSFYWKTIGEQNAN